MLTIPEWWGGMPHRACLATDWMVAVLAVEDALIAAAYLAIPVAVHVLLGTADWISLHVRRAIWSAEAFVVACGLGHTMDVVTLWVPVYGVSAIVDGATVVASWVSAVAILLSAPHWSLKAAADALYRAAGDRRE